MNRKYLLGLVVIFVIGLVTGGVIGVTVTKKEIMRRADLKVIGSMVKKEMTVKLDLDAKQQAQVGPLVNRATDRIHRIYLGTLEQIDDVLLEEQQELESYLRPEQVAKLSTLAKSREEFIRKHNPIQQK